MLYFFIVCNIKSLDMELCILHSLYGLRRTGVLDWNKDWERRTHTVRLFICIFHPIYYIPLWFYRNVCWFRKFSTNLRPLYWFFLSFHRIKYKTNRKLNGSLKSKNPNSTVLTNERNGNLYGKNKGTFHWFIMWNCQLCKKVCKLVS